MVVVRGGGSYSRNYGNNNYGGSRWTTSDTRALTGLFSGVGVLAISYLAVQMVATLGAVIAGGIAVGTGLLALAILWISLAAAFRSLRDGSVAALFLLI